jgi:SAM-dependent methyltransferase
MPVLFLRRWDKRSTVRLAHDVVGYLAALHRFRTQVGLSYLNKSPIYWSSRGYDLAMRLLYGSGVEQTYAEVARRIPDGASVVDLCCGTSRLYRDQLAARGCSYLGLDFNGHFVMQGRRRGISTRFFNVLTDPIPEADYVVMLSSLYHFRSRAVDVLERMQAAARRAVILSEPIRNLSSPKTPLGRLAIRLSNPGVGEYAERFDLRELQALASVHGASELVHAEGERNAIAVFPGLAHPRAEA